MLKQNNNAAHTYKSQQLIGLFFLLLLGSSAFILSSRKNKNRGMNDLNSCDTTYGTCTVEANFVDTNDNTPTQLSSLHGRKLDANTEASATNPSTTSRFPADTNFLIITADDLTATAIPPYVNKGHPMFNPKLNPAWQEFLAKSKVYKATTPMTVCAGARAAFLSGRNPDTTLLNTFETLLPQANNVSTPFMYARQNGYHSFVAGKVFHTYPPQQTLDLEFLTGHLSEQRAATGGGNNECNGYMFCYGPQSADKNIVTTMDKFFARMAQTNKKFFAGAGFHRPHLTQKFPKRFLHGLQGDFANYSIPVLENVDYWHSLAYRDDLDTAKAYKINFGTDKKPKYQKIIQGARKNTHDLFKPRYRMAVKNMRRNYYGSIRFTLSNVGKLVASLKKHNLYEKTVIIFLADHGWLIGDHQILGKNNVFEEATNVPFIVHYAGFDATYMHPEIISTLALYPTIIEMMHGPQALKTFNDGSGFKLDGVSLVSTFFNQATRINDVAITQYPRCQKRGSKQVLDCMTGSEKTRSCDLPKKTYMGYRLEDAEYSCTAWWPYNDVRLGCSWPSWPNMPENLRNVVGGIWSQVDTAKSGTIWTEDPVELQLYRMQNRKPISNNLAIKPTPENLALLNSCIAKIKKSRLIA